MPKLMRDLFQWLRALEQHPLIADIPVESLIYEHQAAFRKNYLQPAIKLRLLVMRRPDHPRNPRQKYRKVI